MKRLLSLLLSVVLVVSICPTTVASNAEHKVAADILYSLGLVSGTGMDASGNPIYELDRAPTRSEAITVLVKLLGKADEAGKGGWEMPFTDVPDWAKNFVGYAYANGLTSGTSATTFGGNDPVTAAQYITFMLKALGYSANGDFAWDKAWELSDQLGITDGRYTAATSEFLRGDVFLISEAALGAKLKETDQTLAEKLMAAGVFQRDMYNRVYGITLPELNAEEVFARCSPAVFFVEVYDASNRLFATGSGFFISSNGLAVTNYHVLEGASRAVITTSDTQQKYVVKGVYDFDKTNDWAVMQVDGAGFKSLDIGSADTVKGGATVFAIGSPRGLQNTISQGLISNPDRELDGIHFIQTSAPISSGSSGGALINKYGQVVGITSAGFAEGQNLNLAMPITVIENCETSKLYPVSEVTPKPSVSYEVDKTSVSVEAGKSILLSMSSYETNINDTTTYSIKSGDDSIATVKWDNMDDEYQPWDIRITGVKAGQTTLTIYNDKTTDVIVIPVIVNAPTVDRQVAAYNTLRAFILKNYNKTLAGGKYKAYEQKNGNFTYRLVYCKDDDGYENITVEEIVLNNRVEYSSDLLLRDSKTTFTATFYVYEAPYTSWSFRGSRQIKARTFNEKSTFPFDDYAGKLATEKDGFRDVSNLMLLDSLNFVESILGAISEYSVKDFEFNCID